MAEQRLGIIMNGVTGRMGTNQHLIRSILAIREQGGVVLANGDRHHARPDPGRPQCGQARGTGQARTASRAGRPTSTRRSPNPDDTLFFDAATTQLRAEAAAARRSPPASTSIARSRSRRTLSDALALASAAKKAGVKNGVVQDKLWLPGPAQAASTLIDCGLFRAHSLGARRVRLLGVRGRLAAGAAPVVELPQGGGRRHHPRYALPLALRARQSLRRGEERLLPGRHPHPQALGREGQALQRARRTTAAYATFQLDGGIVAHFNSSWCTRVRRDDLVTLQVDGTQGSAVAGLREMLDPARGSTRRARCGIPTCRSRSNSSRRGSEVPGHGVLRERLQGAVGDVPPPSRRGCAVQMDAARRRQRRAAGRGGAAQLEGAALDRHPAAEGVMFFATKDCIAADIHPVHLPALNSLIFCPWLRLRNLASFAENELNGCTTKTESGVTCIGASLACSLFVLTRRPPDCKILPGLRMGACTGLSRHATNKSLPVIPAERAGLGPARESRNPSNQSGSCIHAGRGLLGPCSREPG